MFNRSFAECVTLFDFIVSISESTALQIKQLFASHGLECLPISVVPLGHAMLRQSSSELPAVRLRVPRAGIEKNYALCVGTIESRKNHSYLFQVWRALIDNPSLPQLVIVGRVGWRVKDFMEQIELTKGLNGRIKILDNVSDIELAGLYKGAKFTLFPSFVEGWGLPVGESLLYGKLCIASSTSSIPEVGGELVDYIDPLDVTSCIKAVQKIIGSDDYLQSREREIREKFKIRPWSHTITELRRQILELAESCRAKPARSFTNEIPLKTILGAGEQGRPDSPISIFASALQNVIFQTGWYWPEPWGRWISGELAVIRFKVALSEPVRIYLETICVAHAANNQIVLTIGENSVNHLGRGSFGSWIAIDGVPDADGIIELDIKIIGEIKSPDGIDPRRLSIGLKSLFVLPLSDLSGRIDFLERIAFFR